MTLPPESDAPPSEGTALPDAVPDPSAQGALGQHALSGVMFVAMSAFASKIFSLIAQIVLGWVLAKGDFALWGMALSMTALTVGLREGGAGRILMQIGDPDSPRTRAIGQFCWIFSVVGAAALAAIAPFAAIFFNEPRVTLIVYCLAVAVLINTPMAFGRARLSVAMKFKELATIETWTRAVHFSSMIILALLGAGALSFVVPMIISGLFAWILLARALNPLPDGPNLTRSMFAETFSAGRWIMFSSFAGSLASNGDYFVLGRISTTDILSNYFWGFQLTLVISSLITPGVMQILMPTFARLKDEPERQADAFRRVVRITSFVGATACVAMALLAPAMINAVWQGKWDSAIPVVQIMSINLAVRLLAPLYTAMLHSRGHWAMHAISVVFDATLVMSAAYLGVQLGGLATIALTIGAFRCIIPIVYTVVASRVAGIRAREAIAMIALRLGLPIAVGGAIYWIAHATGLSQWIWVDFAFKAVTFGLASAAIAWFACRRDVTDLWNLVRSRRKKSATDG